MVFEYKLLGNCWMLLNLKATETYMWAWKTELLQNT